MKKALYLLLAVVTISLMSCSKDDDNTTTPTTQSNPVVGTWLSQGANVPLGLRMLKVAKVVATFNDNKTYTVVQTDSSGISTTVTGTYIATETTSTDTLSTSLTKGSKIYTIVASQNAPAITATGIYAVSGTNMTYEVIQTTPVLQGVNPPTATGGFGSTLYNGAKLAIYIQKYVKQ